MGYVEVTFYKNGNIESYRCSGIFMNFNISYDKKKGFIDRARKRNDMIDP